MYLCLKLHLESAGKDYVLISLLTLERDAFLKMRSGYAQLGLGSLTGIDLPGEVNGRLVDLRMVSYLDLSIGQYDTYTTLQTCSICFYHCKWRETEFNPM